MFVDTNVLVYARIVEAPQHQAARDRLENARQRTEPLRINRQVLREYLATMTRPQNWRVPLTRQQILHDIQILSEDFEVLEEGPGVTTNLLSLCREIRVGGHQIHDANIVATMLTYGERRLLTFNDADFRRYGEHIELVTG